METQISEFRGHFATPSQEASRAGFGGVLDGFGKDFGRVCADLGRFKEDLEWDLGRFSI